MIQIVCVLEIFAILFHGASKPSLSLTTHACLLLLCYNPRTQQLYTMAVNEHRPTVADIKFQVKEGSSLSSATFIFG